jgi:transposase
MEAELASCHRHDVSDEAWAILEPLMTGKHGQWEKILETLIDNEGLVWLMIDSSCDKVHPHAAGAVGGNQNMERTKGGLTRKCTWPWMRLVVRAESLSQRIPSRIAQVQNN